MFTHIDYFVLHTSRWSKFKEGEGGRGSSWSEYLEGCVVGKRSAESLKWKTVVQPGGRRHYWAGWNPEDFVVMIIIGHNVGVLIMRRPWSQFHWVWILLHFFSLLPQTLPYIEPYRIEPRHLPFLLIFFLCHIHHVIRFQFIFNMLYGPFISFSICIIFLNHSVILPSFHLCIVKTNQSHLQCLPLLLQLLLDGF